MDYLKEFNSLLQNLDRSKSVATVFDDFLSLATLSLAQPFYRSDQFERQYLEIVGRYTKEQANEFSQMLALIVLALDADAVNLGSSTLYVLMFQLFLFP